MKYLRIPIISCNMVVRGVTEVYIIDFHLELRYNDIDDLYQ